MDGAQVCGCGCVCDRDACSTADTQWTPPCVLQTRRVCLHKGVKRTRRRHGPGSAQGIGYHVVSAGRRTTSLMTKAQVKAKGTSLPGGGGRGGGGLGKVHADSLLHPEAPARSPEGLCVWPSRLSGPQGHCCKGACWGKAGAQRPACPTARAPALVLLGPLETWPLVQKKQ